MKKISKQRGSALLIAVVIVILTAGIAGAFFALSAKSSKDTFLRNQTDDAQQICDAGMEMARAALLNWRNGDPDPVPPASMIPANRYSWNKLFAYCALYDAANKGLGTTADPDVIRADALAKFKDVSGKSWAYSGDQTGYNYDKANTPASLGTISSSVAAATSYNSFEQPIQDLFCINRRYGKGAFHLAFKNNTGDLHGDGIDHQDPPSGNAWGNDGKVSSTTFNTSTGQWVTTVTWTGDTANGAGTFDPMIDGDGQAILVVTATLPDGTCHQVEVLLSYPFKGNKIGGAINDNGDINMQGAFNILGSQGSVWANGNITGNGSAQANISGSVNAAGDASGLTMNNKPAGGVNSKVDPIPIAPVNIPDYLSDPKYKAYQDKMIVLHADGTTTYLNGTKVSLPLTLKNGTWQPSNGNTKTMPPMPTNVVLYAEGGFQMTGQGNTAPYNFSVIATGSIELGGNSAFIGATDSLGKPLGPLAIAGADIKLSGNGYAGVQFQGNMFANEQIAIKGTFSLEGSITGANAADTPGSIVSSTSQLSDPDLTIGGTPTIVYNGGGSLVKPDADHLDVKTLHKTRSIAGK